VNNYFITGPESASFGDIYADAFFQMNANQSAYTVGNLVDGSLDGVLNGTPSNTAGSAIVLNAPWAPTTLSIPTLSAVDAYNSLLVSAGCVSARCRGYLCFERRHVVGTEGAVV
jgi:hypothetical protein